VTQVQQAMTLRNLADAVEHDQPLPAEVEEAIARELEDRLDREAVSAARGEPSIPWETVKAELGL
jgi:hypothetical protein